MKKGRLSQQLRAAVLITALGLAPSVSEAAPLTFYYSGLLTQVPSTLSSVFAVGNSFWGSYTFETSTPNVGGDPTLGMYSLAAASATINGLTYSQVGASFQAQIEVGDNWSGGFLTSPSDLLIVNSYPQSGPAVGGLPPDNWFLYLEDSQLSVFSSIGLPSVPPNIGDFELRDFRFSFLQGNSYQQVVGNVTTLTDVPPVQITLDEYGTALLTQNGVTARRGGSPIAGGGVGYPWESWGIGGDIFSGTVLLTDGNGNVSDVLNFHNLGNIDFYSDGTGGLDSPADRLPPLPVDMGLVVTASEGSDGTLYFVSALAGAPGAFRGHDTLYRFISDGRIPEPASLVLLVSGLVGLAGLEWRRHRQQKERSVR